MEEIFKEVKNYEGLYEVSNLGRVKSLGNKHTRKEKILKACVNSRGYFLVSLHKKGVKKYMTVHNLVATAFLNHKSCGYKLVINHINFNKLDNIVYNLEVVTARENCNKKHIKSSSSFVGVYWYKARNKWHSQIQIDGKKHHLGYFINESEASSAYQNALKQI